MGARCRCLAKARKVPMPQPTIIREIQVVLRSQSTLILLEGTMAIKDFLKPHRSWEDAVGLLLGLTIGLTPWLYDQAPVPAIIVNSALTGLAVLMLAQLQIVRLRRWDEVAQLACGVWLVASPFVFDYAHQDHSALLALGTRRYCFGPGRV